MRSLGISLEEVKENTKLHKDVKDVKHKLGIAVEDRAPLPENESNNNPDYYTYYAIRAQDSYTKRKQLIFQI